MASKAPVFGIREISLHGAMRTREDWMKGREKNTLREIDLSKLTGSEGEASEYLGLVIDFTQGVIGVVHEIPGTEENADAPMLQAPGDWREEHEPRDDSPEAHRRIWEAAQAKRTAAAEKVKEPASA